MPPLSAASFRALSIPELLDHMLSELERDELLQPALVDRLWADIARDYIWRAVKKPCQLFRILAPLATHDPVHKFSRAPISSDWPRFLTISRRVRELWLETGDEENPCEDSACLSLVDFMARTRPSIDIFPNMTKLAWWDSDEPHDHSDRITFFLSSNLRTLDIYSPTGNDWYTADAVFDDIICRCPRLEELLITAGNALTPSYANIQAGVARVLRSLSLRVLDLPLYYLSTHILESAAQCGSLQELTIDIAWLDEGQYGDYNDARNLQLLEPPAGYFPNLKTLNLACLLAPFTRMVENPHFPGRNMKMLGVRAVQAESDDTIAALVSVLSTHCRRLESLVLHLARPRGHDDDDVYSEPEDSDEEHPTWQAPPRTEMLSWTTLGLLDFAKLTQLEIIHEYALAVSDDDVVIMAQNMPRLEILFLNGAPGNAEPGAPTLTLHCLYPLAFWLDRLVDLALFVDATVGVDPDQPVAAFQTLERLFLCTSPIRETRRESVTLHLARVLPAGAELVSVRQYVSDWDYTPPVFEPSRLAIWQRVESDLRLIMQAESDWLEDAQT